MRVLTTTANGPAELDVPTGVPQDVNGVEVFYYPRLTKDHTHFSPQLLRQVWKQCRQYDVVHIHSWWNLVAMLSALICRIRGVRFVLSPRGMLSPYTMRSPARRVVFKFMSYFVFGSSVLHATTRQEAEECRQLLPNWKYFIAPNIVPLPPCPLPPAPSSLLPPHCSLLFLSRIDPKKGLEPFFQALSLVSLPFHFTIAGSGDPTYIKSLKILASNHQASGTSHQSPVTNISWPGWLEGPDKFQALADADLLVLTSQNENFANVILEALAMGTPVLLSEHVGLSDYVREKDLGWITSLDPAHIAQTLEAAWRDEEKRTRIREQAPAIIREDFDAVKVAKGYLEGYENITPPTPKNYPC
ncbi:MAG: glycosyltransferase [Lewinellaceae bacterium]|nr:glycosyltransferase [Lewinellaceae bacterium]